MSTRELLTLGTSSLVPSKSRNHNGYFLRWGAEGILFDCGEGTQRQMTFAGLSARSITTICITHFHGDHCLGLPGVLQRISLDQVPHPVRIVYPKAGQEYLERLRDASIYYNQAEIELVPVEVGEEPVEVLRTKEFVLFAAALAHRVPTIGFRIEDLPAYNFDGRLLAKHGITGKAVGELARNGVVEVDGITYQLADFTQPRTPQVFAFVMDTVPCLAATNLAREADLLVMEATYTDELQHQAAEHGHCTASDAARTAVQAQVSQLGLTHFSTRYRSIDQHLAEARAIYPQTVALNDLQKLPLPPAQPKTGRVR